MNSPTFLTAPNGAVIQPGGLYLTFSGDYDAPYRIAKVLRIASESTSIDRPLAPHGTEIPSPDLWLKIFAAQTNERPTEITPQFAAGGFAIIAVSAAAFFAWGPPKFPIQIGKEAVTGAESAQCV